MSSEVFVLDKRKHFTIVNLYKVVMNSLNCIRL